MLKKTKSTNAGFRLTGPSVRIQTDISTVCRSRECHCGELANKHAHQRKRVLVGLFFLRKITSPPVDPGRGCFHVFRAMEPLVVFACVDTLNAVAYSLSADGRTDGARPGRFARIQTGVSLERTVLGGWPTVPLIVVVHIHTCNNFIVYMLAILNQTGVSLQRAAGAVRLYVVGLRCR